MKIQNFCALVALSVMVALPMGANAQQKISNRYSMELVEVGDGTYELKKRDRYKYINLNEVPDLLTVYEHKNIASSKLYKSCVSEEYVYKSYPDYDLKLIVDRAVSDTPAPFIVWIHGGGWSKGNNNAFRISSQYIAVQKGIAGVRIAYSLAGQTGATIDVSLEDIEDAVKWVQEHAEELNINPKSFGFCGQSAGAHLSAASAMTIKGTKAMVGYAGAYNLPLVEGGVVKSPNSKMRYYFHDYTDATLGEYSPVNMVPRKNIPAVLLFHGTGDSILDHTQSVEFAEVLKSKGADVTLDLREYYDHNLHSKRSDIGGELLLLTANFFEKHLK
ncbi:MAG: alpha/beta hydrolase [Tidjanibacter sp.]|nr:alpha/beta hydrolase [Tidjanibacter sp.]